jgi:RNA polymerase sigma-70 factor (ECF subfamily)
VSERAEFAELYEATVPAVWRFVRSRTNDDAQAEDLTSEVYVRALAAWDRYDADRGTVTAWLCGIAAHAVQESRRRRRWTSLSGWTEPSSDDGDGATAEPEALMLQVEALMGVRKALASLSERERDALALRFAGGLHAWEAGLILGLSAGATKMLLFRAMKRLRTVLEQGAASADDRAGAEALDQTLERLLAGREAGLAEPWAERLVRQLAVIYTHPVPEGLGEKLKAAVTCPVARMVRRPGRHFQGAAAFIAASSLAAAGWRWQAALPTSPDPMEMVLLVTAGCAVLGGLALLARRPTIGSGTVGIGALIFAFCLWWTGIAPLMGLILAGTAFRQAAQLHPETLAFGSLAGKE